jgi:hypothetical protein
MTPRVSSRLKEGRNSGPMGQDGFQPRASSLWMGHGKARSTKSSDRVPRTEPEVLPEKRGIFGTGMATFSPGRPGQRKRFGFTPSGAMKER